MDGYDRLERRKTWAEWMGLKDMSCCGAPWGTTPSTVSIRGDEDEDEDQDGPQQIQHEEEEQIEVRDAGRTFPDDNNSDTVCDDEVSVTPVMNLADALAAERHFQAEMGSDAGFIPSPGSPDNDVTERETPLRVSLMRLLAETDGQDETEKEEKGVGLDLVCCVCMGRKKGAAFIPCGHTFCRVCTRELWLNRGSCPLCNRPIDDILDIF